MEGANRRFIRDALRSSEDFREDLARYLQLKPEQIESVRDGAALALEGELAGDALKVLATQVEASEPAASRLAFMHRFLSGRLTEGGDVDAFIEELSDIGRVALDDQKKEVLRKALLPRPGEVAEERERKVFSFGESISAVESKTIITFDLDGEPLSGVSLTVSVLDGAGESKSISANVGAGELRAIARGLLHAADRADADLRRIRGGNDGMV